jgi:NHS family xanthosine MFS transporter
LGTWLITIANYWFGTMKWDGTQQLVLLERWNCFFIYANNWGIIADRWINAEKLYGALHILYGVVLFFIHKWQHLKHLFM